MNYELHNALRTVWFNIRVFFLHFKWNMDKTLQSTSVHVCILPTQSTSLSPC